MNSLAFEMASEFWCCLIWLLMGLKLELTFEGDWLESVLKMLQFLIYMALSVFFCYQFFKDLLGVL